MNHPLGHGAGSHHYPDCPDPLHTSHCWFHGDEPIANGEPYIVCFECGHVYQTAEDLMTAFEREVGRSWTDSPDRIPSCPECIHDF